MSVYNMPSQRRDTGMDDHTDLFKSIEDMILQTFSHRAFMFYKHKGASYAISVSSTEHGYETVGFEIEEGDEEETATLVSLSWKMNYGVSSRFMDIQYDVTLQTLLASTYCLL
jgi:hypothetical protein